MKGWGTRTCQSGRARGHSGRDLRNLCIFLAKETTFSKMITGDHSRKSVLVLKNETNLENDGKRWKTMENDEKR